MKIYSKKKFFFSLIGLFIALAGIVALFQKGFDLKLTILSIFMFLISINGIQKSFSKASILKEKIEERDERTQLVNQRSSAFSFKIVQYFAIILETFIIIFYGIYREAILVPVIIVLAFIVFVSFISEIFSSIYFEKKL